MKCSLPFPSRNMANAADRHSEKLPAAWREAVKLPFSAKNPGKSFCEFVSSMYPLGVQGSGTFPSLVEFAARIETLYEFCGNLNSREQLFQTFINNEPELCSDSNNFSCAASYKATKVNTFLNINKGY